MRQDDASVWVNILNNYDKTTAKNVFTVTVKDEHTHTLHQFALLTELKFTI